MVKKTPAAAESALPASFEDAVAELETLVQRMEGGSLSLEDSLAAYKRGRRTVTRTPVELHRP